MHKNKLGVGTYTEFRENILPRIIEAGYNTIQLMAIMEHPYYGSFAIKSPTFLPVPHASARPEELKALIDAAHAAGIAVIMDLVHSHAVKNEREGLSLFDAPPINFFTMAYACGMKPDSRCFDYGKTDVLHFLLSNCRYWIDEFRFDGFRFDGITSMLNLHHGLGIDLPITVSILTRRSMNSRGSIAIWPIASYMPCAPTPSPLPKISAVCPAWPHRSMNFGAGFDYRIAMGVPECWFHLVRDVRDEEWSIGYLWHELTNRRADEQTVNYVESHDQALSRR